MKLIIIVPLFILFGLGDLADPQCSEVTGNFKCTKPLEACEDKVKDWTSCECEEDKKCITDNDTNCKFLCVNPKAHKPDDNNADMSLFAGLANEMKNEGDMNAMENANPVE